ncbi:MAG: hypothetical protein KatS3mg023_2107 [Armatimonadota bacterium]|nr:MAG: hypothetical protein KatS3mg023_2107 [Armatimonadota bacterium]
MTKGHIALGAFILALLLCTEAAWSRRMPRGSFLTQPAYSAAQLATQVRTNPTVAARYSRHFGISASEFAQYAQSQLGMRPLPRGGRFRVFFILPGGDIESRVRYLRQGTPVFLHLRSGQPVLLGTCGNPLTEAIPGYTPPRQVTVAPPRVPQPPVTPPQEPPLLEPPVSTAAHEIPEAPVFPPTEEVMLSHWQADPITTPLEPTSPAVSARRPNWIPLLLLALPGIMESEGKPAKPPAVIPEPASVASLATAVALLITWERRRRVWRR